MPNSLTSSAGVRPSIERAEQAIELRPGFWEYYNTLGIAYYGAARYRDAIVALETRLKNGGGEGDGPDLYWLAMCHHRLGDAARAADCFARAEKWSKEQAEQLEPEDRAELQRFRTEASKVLMQPPRGL